MAPRDATAAALDTAAAELELQGLRKRFGNVVAVEACNLAVARGEIVALLGPSGCGKSTLLNVIAGFEAPDAGTVRLRGKLLNDVPPHRRNIAMVFQHYAMFPHLTVAENIAYGLRARRLDGATIRARVAEMVALLQLAGLEDRYPAQLSGGQRQRVSLARALIIAPRIVICDEIVSGLDVSVQAQVLTLITDLQQRLGLGLIFISHDLRVVHYLCDRVAVMYLGRIVEEGSVADVFGDPRHPYTRALLSAVPGHVAAAPVPIRGEPASLLNLPPGCPFADRCPEVMPVCREAEPPPQIRNGHMARCIAASL